ncbi:RNA polymerase sigma factor [Flavobacterium rhizosphaerae]|uniref:Sigma-70 family RNA polymerase sigma factor n=1 Tax=Flavobacterium rhizosphaerae TaxID=3163298 RepID=A0ABW8YX46_9FLAO
MKTNLIKKLREGDETSFKEVYELYHYKVFCFAKKYTSQVADAEDITQNVFIHIWNYKTKLNPDTSFEAILFKSSKQEISKWYKKQNNFFSIEDTQLIKELEMAEETEEIDVEKIEKLLQQIPERRRKIFKLHKLEDKSYNEIALEMNMSTSAVANQVSKTLQFLKKNSLKYYEFYFMLLFIGNN